MSAKSDNGQCYNAKIMHFDGDDINERRRVILEIVDGSQCSALHNK